MIEKRFIDSYCVSCGNETPVIFDITDLNHELLYSIPLCRKCSNIFAEDVIDALKKKVENKNKKLVSKNNEVIQLKCKVKRMNIISHNHKEEITKLRNVNKLEKEFELNN